MGSTALLASVPNYPGNATEISCKDNEELKNKNIENKFPSRNNEELKKILKTNFLEGTMKY